LAYFIWNFEQNILQYIVNQKIEEFQNMLSNEKSANNLQISQQKVDAVAGVQNLSTPQAKTRGLGGGGNARKRKFWAILASLISLGGGAYFATLFLVYTSTTPNRY